MEEGDFSFGLTLNEGSPFAGNYQDFERECASIDWAELRERDPAAALAAQDSLDARRAQLRAADAAFQARNDRRAAVLAEHVRREYGEEIADPRAFRCELLAYADARISADYPDPEHRRWLLEPLEPSALILIDAARRWNEMQKRKSL